MEQWARDLAERYTPKSVEEMMQSNALSWRMHSQNKREKTCQLTSCLRAQKITAYGL
jgi:hypothetical protein